MSRTPDVFDFDEENPGDDGGVTCNRCGQGPFTWAHTGLRWALTDDTGAPHHCPGIKLMARLSHDLHARQPGTP